MSPPEPVRLLRCDSPAELGEAVALRTRLFKSRSGLEFDQAAERVRDAHSLVFLLTVGGVGVATSRMAPYPSLGSGLWGTGAQFPSEGVDSEVGRLAAERCAAQLEYSVLLMVLGAFWVLESTEHRIYASYVNPRLVRLYASVGAEDTGHTCEVPGRSAPYTIVRGRYEDCVRLGGEALGATVEQLAALVRWDASHERTVA